MEKDFEIYKEGGYFLCKCSKCGAELCLGDQVEEYKGSILCEECCVNSDKLFYLE